MRSCRARNLLPRCTRLLLPLLFPGGASELMMRVGAEGTLQERASAKQLPPAGAARNTAQLRD